MRSVVSTNNNPPVKKMVPRDAGTGSDSEQHEWWDRRNTCRWVQQQAIEFQSMSNQIVI
ncbi:MAG: hypothetical protein MZV63_36005 [Marinilabiliales bacterium]|nr:hypothetical protein [Marinilabiliales bacterium]